MNLTQRFFCPLKIENFIKNSYEIVCMSVLNLKFPRGDFADLRLGI